MSQELYEVTCVKHQITEQTNDPDNWVCPIDKQKVESPFSRVTRCGNGHTFVGNGSCPKCQIAEVKRKAELRIPLIEQEKKLHEGNSGIIMAQENKRLQKLKAEKLARESLIKLPELLIELINEIKQLRGDMKHV